MTIEMITVNPAGDEVLDMPDTLIEPAEPEKTEPAKTDDPPTITNDNFLKRSAELNQLEQQIKNDFEKLNSEREAIQTKLQMLDELKKSPYKTLEKLGVNIDDFFHDYMGMVNEQPVDEVSKVKKELQELKDSLKQQQEDKEKTESEKKQANEQQQWKEYIRQVKDYVSQKDEYELLHANEAYEDVLNVIKEAYTTSGKQLSLDEACLQIENRFDEKANKLLALKKIKSKFETPAPSTNEPKSDSRRNTITSKLVGSTAQEVYGKRDMTEDERFAEAVRILKAKETN